MKVAVVGTVASSIFGFRLPFLEYMVGKGFSVYALAIDFSEKQKLELIQKNIIPIDYKMHRSSVNPLSSIISAVNLYKVIKSISPDIYFGYFLKPVVLGGVIAKLTGVKSVIGMIEGLGYSFTEDEKGFSKKKLIIMRILTGLFKISSKFIDKLIVLNFDDKNDLEHIANFKSISVLGGIGVDLDEYRYVPNKENLEFIFVARLLKEKGIEQFLAAAKKVKSVYPNVTFTVLGDFDAGNPSSLDKSKMNALVNEGVVRHLGHVNNVKPFLENASVFVLPSYYREGVPRSTQEAMAIGRAIITSDYVGCKETVINGYNGFLVTRWDVDMLVEKVLAFVETPEIIDSMGKSSRSLAEEKFDMNDVNERLLRLVLDA